MKGKELLVAALAALEDASWEVLGEGRIAFIRVFSRRLAEELRELGYEKPEEQLELAFDEGFTVEETNGKIVVKLDHCPFCTVEEIAHVDNFVCVVVGWLEELFDGIVYKVKKENDSCTLFVEKDGR